MDRRTLKETGNDRSRQDCERYIDLWNETDAQSRKKLIASAWTEDATYVDPMMKGRDIPKSMR